MESCDLGTPRQPSNRGIMTGGDETTEDMKMLYRAAQEQFGREWCSKKQLYDLAKQLELFSWWDLEDRKGQTAFGKAINRFNGRHLGGVAMEGGGTKNNRRYRFALVSGSSKIAATDAGTLRTSDEVYSGAMPEPTLSPNPKKGTSRTLGTSTTQQEVKNSGTYTEERTEDNAELLHAHGVKQVHNVLDVPSPEYRVLTDSSLLGEVAASIRKAEAAVALDIETYGNGLNPWRGDVRLLSLAIPDHPPWLLDLKEIGYDLGELGKCLQDRQVIAHNAKFDLLWLRHKCGLKLNNIFCTLTAARLLSNGKREIRNGLYACWERFLGLPPGKTCSSGAKSSPSSKPRRFALARYFSTSSFGA